MEETFLYLIKYSFEKIPGESTVFFLKITYLFDFL